MQNWNAMQSTACYQQQNNWYANSYGTSIKTEPGTVSPPNQQASLPLPQISQLEQYIRNHQAEQQAQKQRLSPAQSMNGLPLSPNHPNGAQNIFDNRLQQQLYQQQQYQQQFQQAQQAAAQQHFTPAHMPLGFNPLTPPGLPTAILPPMTSVYNAPHPVDMRAMPQTPSPQTRVIGTPMDASEKIPVALTPRNTPPIDITPPKSPRSLDYVNDSGIGISGIAPSDSASVAETENDMISNVSEDTKQMGGESDEDESIRMPIYNSHGKMKNYKCKSCGMVAITKVAFWEHASTHMKPEKILHCPKCPFVTELKHHLEYHIRKHRNIKPFRCDQCSYTCVNKSMLNSHLKSHSAIYQYRCSTCDYITKYCHSFKLHLRKYEHVPDVVLDESGVPNPSIVIDVYGTRRGPKSKSSAANRRNKNGGNNRSNSHSVRNSVRREPQPRKAEKPSEARRSQSVTLPEGKPQQQQPTSTAKSTNSKAAAVRVNLPQENQQQQNYQQPKPQEVVAQVEPVVVDPPPNANAVQNLLPPLALILQQNPNISLLPYLNLNIQMFLAQQAAIFSQLPPSMREFTLQYLQKYHTAFAHQEEEENHTEHDHNSNDSAMDLSQSLSSGGLRTPSPEGLCAKTTRRQRTPAAVSANLKLQETKETPVNGNNRTAPRKGRMLQLDAWVRVKSASDLSSPEPIREPSKLPLSPATVKLEDDVDADEDDSMDGAATPTNNVVVLSDDSPEPSTNSASSSGKTTGSKRNSVTHLINMIRSMKTCQFCQIHFSDEKLYALHMKCHCEDDVFKCNLCGEKCNNAVDLYMHVTYTAHE